MPALNKHTHEIETLNYLEEMKEERYLFFFKKSIKKRKNYFFYTEPEMFINNGDDRSYCWGDLKIKMTGNLCPRCNSYNLQFEHGILFD